MILAFCPRTQEMMNVRATVRAVKGDWDSMDTSYVRYITDQRGEGAIYSRFVAGVCAASVKTESY
jgi:hypothetical protein